MFFTHPTISEIYTLSLHDALPISGRGPDHCIDAVGAEGHTHGVQYLHDRAKQMMRMQSDRPIALDRKSTRLNSSHLVISYAVFCLKKKNKQRNVKHEISMTTL